MANRREAERKINEVFYGTDTELGRDLLFALIAEHGTAALTDEAVIKLAEMHERRHDENIGFICKF